MHQRGQFIYPHCGRLRVLAGGRIWSGTPRQGIWVPPHVKHQVFAVTDMVVHSAYIDTQAVEGTPATCHAVNATPLLRELMSFGKDLAEGSTPPCEAATTGP